MKKKVIVILGLLLVLGLSFGVYIIKNKSEFHVVINNETNETINGLEISSGGTSDNINVGGIEAGKSKNLVVKTKEAGDLVMYYTDIAGNYHKEILAGYYKPGAKGKVVVNITSVDAFGVYSMEIASPAAEALENN